MKAPQLLRFPACMGLILFVALGLLQNASAGSATWRSNPASGDWNTAENWTPATVPNGSRDVATFATANTADVSVSANTEVSGITFDDGANSFALTADPLVTLTISGSGITNNGSLPQNFVTADDSASNIGAIV